MVKLRWSNIHRATLLRNGAALFSVAMDANTITQSHKSKRLGGKGPELQPAQDDKRDGALSGVIGDLIRLADERERVSVADIRGAFGNRSFGPFLLLPALLEISPIGGIPGLPTAIALVIALFSIQIALGRKHLWLPDFIERQAFGAERFQKAVEWLHPYARHIDRVIKPRLRWATNRPWLNIFALICIVLAATVPPLEIIPFASTIPMASIALFGIAIFARDGAVAICAALMAIGAFYLLITTFIVG